MTENQITRILDGMGISGLSGLQLPSVRTLVLTTNQGIEYNQDVITFDTANDLVKIKSFKCEGISGRFDDNWEETDTGIKFNKVLAHRWYPFRDPKKGDIIFIVRNGELANLTTSIAKIDAENRIVFEDEIDLRRNDIICYADPIAFANNPVADPTDPSLLLKKTPISDNAFDTYLDMNELVGIESVMGMAANF